MYHELRLKGWQVNARHSKSAVSKSGVANGDAHYMFSTPRLKSLGLIRAGEQPVGALLPRQKEKA